MVLFIVESAGVRFGRRSVLAGRAERIEHGRLEIAIQIEGRQMRTRWVDASAVFYERADADRAHRLLKQRERARFRTSPAPPESVAGEGEGGAVHSSPHGSAPLVSGGAA